MPAKNTKLEHVPDDALKEIVLIQNRIKQLGVRESANRFHRVR